MSGLAYKVCLCIWHAQACTLSQGLEINFFWQIINLDELGSTDLSLHMLIIVITCDQLYGAINFAVGDKPEQALLS